MCGSIICFRIRVCVSLFYIHMRCIGGLLCCVCGCVSGGSPPTVSHPNGFGGGNIGLGRVVFHSICVSFKCWGIGDRERGGGMIAVGDCSVCLYELGVMISVVCVRG